MTSAERRDLLPFLREVAKVPHVILAREAEKLIERFQVKRRPVPERKLAKPKKRLITKAARADVRAQVAARAGGKCECGCGLAFTSLNPAEWDEFYGRRHVTVEETWMLRRSCHHDKSENRPDRETWDRLFMRHCATHGYRFRARLTKTIARRPQQRGEPRMERFSRGPTGFSSGGPRG